MLDKRCTNRDIRRLGHYREIISMKAAEFTINDLVNAMHTCSRETILNYCKYLVKIGYLSVEKKPSVFNYPANFYQVLKKDFNESDLEAASVMIARDKKEKGIVKAKAEVKEVNPTWLMTVIERHVPRVDKPRSPRAAMVSSMSAAAW